MLAIKTNNLCKQYKNIQAVKDLNIEIKEGQLVSLLGVNGAGKTTTIKMLSCLIQPTSGDASLFNQSVVDNPYAVKEFINVSPQETAIAPHLTTYENLEFICGVYGFHKQETYQKVHDIIDSLKLHSIVKQKAQTLSGGWQRRLSIAMALITEPKILFLDEPTLGLDVLARRELWEVIENLKGKMTIILTTHYLEEAEALSDQIIIMADGKFIAQGTSEELKTKVHKDSFEDAFVELCKLGGKV